MSHIIGYSDMKTEHTDINGCIDIKDKVAHIVLHIFFCLLLDDVIVKNRSCAERLRSRPDGVHESMIFPSLYINR